MSKQQDIPQSELDRIRKEAKESSFIVREVHGNYEQALLIENGYIAGASSEYLRSASELEQLRAEKERLRAKAQEIVIVHDEMLKSDNEDDHFKFYALIKELAALGVDSKEQ